MFSSGLVMTISFVSIVFPLLGDQLHRKQSPSPIRFKRGSLINSKTQKITLKQLMDKKNQIISELSEERLCNPLSPAERPSYDQSTLSRVIPLQGENPSTCPTTKVDYFYSNTVFKPGLQDLTRLTSRTKYFGSCRFNSTLKVFMLLL